MSEESVSSSSCVLQYILAWKFNQINLHPWNTNAWINGYGNRECRSRGNPRKGEVQSISFFQYGIDWNFQPHHHRHINLIHSYLSSVNPMNPINVEGILSFIDSSQSTITYTYYTYTHCNHLWLTLISNALWLGDVGCLLPLNKQHV